MKTTFELKSKLFTEENASFSPSQLQYITEQSSRIELLFAAAEEQSEKSIHSAARHELEQGMKGLIRVLNEMQHANNFGAVVTDWDSSSTLA